MERKDTIIWQKMLKKATHLLLSCCAVSPGVPVLGLVSTTLCVPVFPLPAGCECGILASRWCLAVTWLGCYVEQQEVENKGNVDDARSGKITINRLNCHHSWCAELAFRLSSEHEHCSSLLSTLYTIFINCYQIQSVAMPWEWVILFLLISVLWKKNMTITPVLWV